MENPHCAAKANHLEALANGESMRNHILSSAIVAVFSIAAVHCSSDPVTPPAGSGGSGGAGGGGGANACDSAPSVTPVADIFMRHAVDVNRKGPAYASAADINGDGRTDLVISRIGTTRDQNGGIALSKAEVSIYLRGESLDCWQEVPLIGAADDLYFPGQSTVDDIDGDGDLDIALGFGFFVCQFDGKVGPCGAVLWMEQTPSGWKRHDIVPEGDSEFFHKAVFVDFDGDGTKDLLTVGETQPAGGKVYWFKGDTASPDRFNKEKLEIGSGAGSFAQAIDIDGDGDLDVASAAYFAPNTPFSWFERTAEPSAAAPAGVFVQHLINNDSGRGIQMELVPNFYGDGKLVAIATNHVNTANPMPDPVESAVMSFEMPADPTMPWTKTVLSTGIVSRPNEGLGVNAAPGVFGHGDVDGDGDEDIVVSGDGDIRTFWLEQTAKGVFTTHVLEQSLGQAGGCLVKDLDGDGKNEVVFTGYEDNAVYVYERK